MSLLTMYFKVDLRYYWATSWTFEDTQKYEQQTFLGNNYFVYVQNGGTPTPVSSALVSDLETDELDNLEIVEIKDLQPDGQNFHFCYGIVADQSNVKPGSMLGPDQAGLPAGNPDYVWTEYQGYFLFTELDDSVNFNDLNVIEKDTIAHLALGSGVQHAFDGNDTVFLPDSRTAAYDAKYRVSDWFCGDDGNDLIFGGALNDKIDGGKGKDDIAPGAGNDQIDGGEGIFDRAVYSDRTYLTFYNGMRGEYGDIYVDNYLNKDGKKQTTATETDHLIDVEFVKFKDHTFRLDPVWAELVPITEYTTHINQYQTANGKWKSYTPSSSIVSEILGAPKSADF